MVRNPKGMKVDVVMGWEAGTSKARGHKVAKCEG